MCPRHSSATGRLRFENHVPWQNYYQPLYDPIAQVLHTSSGNSVSHVWVNGECLLDEGTLTRMDEQEIVQTARSWQQRIRPQ